MAAAAKVLPVPVLATLREEIGRNGATFGLCHGCFDILHQGHVHHLRQAAERVDVLVVSITPARYVNKGEGRPIFDDQARMSVMAALEVVDYVVLNDEPTAVSLIRTLRPDIYIKGADYESGDDPKLAAERDALIEIGGKFLITDGSVFDSSTRAVNVLRPLEQGQ